MASDRTASEQVVQTLRNSPNLIAGIIASAMDAIIVIDDRQQVALFNTAAEQMFACPAHEALGSSVERFIPQRLRAEHSAHVRRFGEDGLTDRAIGTPGALWGLRSTGEEFPIEATISKVEGDGQKFYTVMIRDITERHRAEAALRESEQRFRFAADNAPVMMWMSGTDKLCSYFNQPWLDFTGRSLEQEFGNGWAEGVHPEDVQRCHETYTQAFDRREKFGMEYRLRHHDGEYRWVLDIGVPRFDEDGSFVGYIGILVDLTDRKRVEEAGLRHTAILESSDDAIIATAVSGTITDWNKGAERIFGYTSSEAIGKDLSYLSPKDRSEEGQRIFTSVLNGETLRHRETVRQRKDGTRVDISLTASPMFDANGRVVGVSGIARDITERKMAEERLRESEEQFRTLAEAIPQLCWMAHSDGYTFWYNQRWYRYTGTTPEQMEGWGWQSVHDPRTLPDERERWKASISTGEPLDMVFTLRGSDGVFRPFLTRAVPLKDSDGRVVRWFGTNTDITELHKAQEELSTSEERLRLAQKAAGIGTFEWNIQTGAKIWTPELEAMHGLPPGGFEKRQSIFEDLIHPEDRAMITELIDSALKSRQSTEAEWRVVWEDGSVHWLAGRWDVFINGSGEAVRMIGVNVDVTRRKRTEEALLTVNRKLIEAREKLNVEEKLAAMGRLASGIAHEIRNPVAMISSSLATAANSDVAAADRAEMVQIASGEAKRLEHLTTDFLTYARPGAPQRSQVPVNDLLSYVADVVKSHAAKKAIQVIYVPAENFAADVDPTQVHGALLNLVLNGMDAAHSPGSVTLGAARKQAFIQIDVQNTGEPISELDLPRIFEPFYSTKPSGTGLGLAIARRVAQTHGGDLWVSCNQKDRVTFSMTLPGCS